MPQTRTRFTDRERPLPFRRRPAPGFLFPVLAGLFLAPLPAAGQWSGGPGDIYYDRGDVGIGMSRNPASLLHLFSSRDRDGLTLQVSDNQFSQGIAFRNSVGSYTWRLYRQNAGANRADLVFASGLGSLTSLRPVVVFRDNGRVGVGTTAPAARLHVRDGNLLVSRSVGDPSLELLDEQTGNAFRLLHRAKEGRLELGRVGGEAGLTLLSDGRLGVGTTEVPAGFHLAVQGKVLAEEIQVELREDWPADFVFLPEYPLLPLPELDRWIAEHGHLPEVPSAQEMQAQGIGVGQMQFLLLRKIEELTLHVIALNQENDRLRSELERKNEELERRLAALEERLAR